jgi:hypothetical protein
MLVPVKSEVTLTVWASSPKEIRKQIEKTKVFAVCLIDLADS